ERDVLSHLHHVSFGGKCVGSKTGLTEKRAVDRLPALPHGHGAVCPSPSKLKGEPRGAVAWDSLAARRARAAGDVAHDDMVPWCNLLHARSHLLHHPRPFVAEDCGQ